MAVTSQLTEDGVLTISVSSRFDITTYKEFSDAYKDKVDSASKWVIDLSEVEYLDSSALGMLLMLRERAGGESVEIDIVNCSSHTKKIFETAKFDKLFNIQ